MDSKKYQSQSQQSLNPLSSISLQKIFLYGLVALVTVVIIAKFMEATKPPSAEMAVLREVEAKYLTYKSDDRTEVDRSECETNWKSVTNCSRSIYNTYTDLSMLQNINNRLLQDNWKLVVQDKEKQHYFIYQKNVNGYKICARTYISSLDNNLKVSFSTDVRSCR